MGCNSKTKPLLHQQHFCFGDSLCCGVFQRVELDGEVGCFYLHLISIGLLFTTIVLGSEADLAVSCIFIFAA